MELVYLSKKPEDLQPLVEAVLILLPEDGTLLLDAPMGAGKTSFVRQLCATLGIHDVSSPTYSIVNEYEAKRLVYHFDCYRIEEEEEALDFGLEEYLQGPGFCLIEWPERISSLLSDEFARLQIEVLPNEDRKYILTF